MHRELLTLREVAALLGCSLNTVKRRVAEGDLPVFASGRLVRVRQADLDRYVAERTARRLPAGGAVAAGREVAAGVRLWD